MARKQIVFVVTKEGRDKGKKFHIKEMASRKAEEWAIRVGFALAKSQVDIGEIKGWQGLAYAGLQTLQHLEFGDAKPLLDEMMECVKIEPSPGVIRELIDDSPDGDGDDIQELVTRKDIRVEIFKLHADFFINAETTKTD